jgi:hypothetical protein
MEMIDVVDLDCIFLSYDEPLKDEFWIKIKNIAPWAKRVDGVKGSDAAHKAAAAASTTERFILIDGDNLPHPDFFNVRLTVEDNAKNAVYRWRARNHVNGLMYGNGGMSCWTKTFVNNMQTHEASDGSADTAVEFCFDPMYWAMHDCYSTTYPNGSPFQAWRAGFREGVKMCLDRGAKPTLEEFKDKAHKRNLDNLTIWHNVGADVENGEWAIYGARMGTFMTMIDTTWDYTEVQDFDKLSALWEKVKNNNPVEQAGVLGFEMANKLDLPMFDFTSEQSKFFKHHYKSNWNNLGPMVKEIDVIRKQEGW